MTTNVYRAHGKNDPSGAAVIETLQATTRLRREREQERCRTRTGAPLGRLTGSMRAQERGAIQPHASLLVSACRGRGRAHAPGSPAAHHTGLLRARGTGRGRACAELAPAALPLEGGARHGVRLLEITPRPRTRLLVTTAFGATSEEALTLATRLGANVRVLNPGSGRNYHPKVYLGRRADRAAALVGSVNLTSGLAVNIEAASHLKRRSSDRPIRELWDWAEALWRDPRVAEWQPAVGASCDESIDPELLRMIQAAAREQPRFYTLGPSPRLNYVAEVTPAGLYVETERSRERTGGAEVIEPWMLNLAWEVLRSRGELTNQTLLKELRVHRSSAVCAVLARRPGVEAQRGRGIRLRWAGQ